MSNAVPSIGMGSTISFAAQVVFAVCSDGIHLPEVKADMQTFSFMADKYKRKISGQIDSGDFSVDVYYDSNDATQSAFLAYFTGSAPTSSNTGIAVVYTYPNAKTLTFSSVLSGLKWGDVDANDLVKCTISGSITGFITAT